MASGRSSCTVGAFGTAEVYNNASGGASSITFYATSTDRAGCFNISVNISNASITPEASSTIYCACAGKCSDLTYGHVANVDVNSSGAYTGHICHSPTSAGIGCCHSNVCFFRSTGDVICPCSAGVAAYIDIFAPMPWTGSIENHTPCCEGLNFLPYQGECGRYTIYNLSCFKCHGGTVEFDRALEWNAAKTCSFYSRAACACPDRDNCCGTSAQASYRAAYGVVGEGENSCSLKNTLNGSYTADYWSQTRYVARVDDDSANCMTSIFHTNQLYSRQNCCFACYCCCANNCQMIQECIHCHCFNVWCRKLQTVNMSTATLQCCLACTCKLPGGFDHARSQRLQTAACNVIAFDNALCNVAIFRAKNPCQDIACMFYACNEQQCSVFRLDYCKNNANNGTSGIKWGTYDCATKKNYYLWWHDNTPDWNGIYTIDSAQQLAIHEHTVCCQCTCLAYSAGDEIPTTLMTKAADVPSVWTSSYTAKNVTYTNAHSIGPSCWVTLLHDWSEGGWNSKRYTSTDLLNWTLDSCTNLILSLGECKSFVGKAACIDITTSCYFSLCDSGQLENKTEGLQLERTGIVTSNGDRIYVCNCSTNPVSINVWGYEE